MTSAFRHSYMQRCTIQVQQKVELGHIRFGEISSLLLQLKVHMWKHGLEKNRAAQELPEGKVFHSTTWFSADLEQYYTVVPEAVSINTGQNLSRPGNFVNVFLVWFCAELQSVIACSEEAEGIPSYYIWNASTFPVSTSCYSLLFYFIVVFSVLIKLPHSAVSQQAKCVYEAHWAQKLHRKHYLGMLLLVLNLTENWEVKT